MPLATWRLFARWIAAIAVSTGLGWIFYRSSIARAAEWGDLVRGVFDLYRADVLREILARATREDANATDEAGLAAKYGHHVHLVRGDSMNFKITRPEDLVMAERIFAEWGGEGDA